MFQMGTDIKKRKSEQMDLFYEALNFCFKRSDLKQFQLADAAGITSPMMSQLMNRKNTCDIITQELIAKALGYELSDFLDIGRRLLAGDAASIHDFQAEQKILHPEKNVLEGGSPKTAHPPGVDPQNRFDPAVLERHPELPELLRVYASSMKLKDKELERWAIKKLRSIFSEDHS